MESNSITITTSPSKFLVLNFNLKKIIFSFLEISDQRTVYWLNKKLRPFLPDSGFKINNYLHKQICSCEYKGILWGMLELNGGEFALFTDHGVKLLKLDYNQDNHDSGSVKRKNLILTKSVPLKTVDITLAFQLNNGNIIYTTGYELSICDKNFNSIQNFRESNWIRSLCNISENSFAIGLSNGIIKIYKQKEKAEEGQESSPSYYKFSEFKFHTFNVWSLLYIPKLDYLLSTTFNLVNVMRLSDEKSVKNQINHKDPVTQLVLLNEEKFASASKREIKIWSIEEDFKCLHIIDAYEFGKNPIKLYPLGRDFMVATIKRDFEIWDLQTYQFLKPNCEESIIVKSLVTKNQDILTATSDRQVNFWKIAL